MNYKKTLIACYLGFVTQAIAANFAPLLFLTFHNNYNISLGKIALISSVFFITQLIVDILCARFADTIGYRNCVVGSQLLSAVGLIGLAFLPQVTPDPFAGIIISTVLYAIGSGLTEVLVSPIVEACPFEHKEAAMSLLHSFYCWGAVAVILLSTLFFAPVSYTHLDVYKRQELYRRGILLYILHRLAGSQDRLGGVRRGRRYARVQHSVYDHQDPSRRG